MSVQLTAEQQLVEDIAGFTHDPLGYALYCFPWGMKGTELENKRLRSWQREVLDGIGQRLRSGVVDIGEVIREATASGHGIGKALGNQEPVLTPSGWQPIGEIRVGDMVATVDGSFTRVEGVYPQGRVPLYRVAFDDGSSVLTCAEHQWETTTRSERKHGRAGSVRTTAEIAESLTFPNGPLRGLNHQVPVLSAVRHPTAVLAVDPYLLGMWLGDGSPRGRIGVALPEKVAAVAGAIFSVCAYDVYSGFAEVMHNSTPFLGSDYFYSLTIYSFIVVVFLSLIIYPLRRKKRKPVLTFNSQSANSLLINKNVK